MPDEQQKKLPAIILSRFSAGAGQIAMAEDLLGRGYSVIAACEHGGEAAGVARRIGCACVEAGGEEGLRAGLGYFEREMRGLPGVVAVDTALSGYSVDDVTAVAEALIANPDKFIAASRAVSRASGLLHRAERRLAATAFALVHGRKVRDPWSGLMAIPADQVCGFMSLKGEGRRLAFNMALNLQHLGVKALSVPVGATDEPEAGVGFWDRATDIFQILLLPLKFISASLAATAADYAVFLLLDTVLIPGRWAVSMTTSRSAGAAVGYFLNRNLVFRQKNNSWRKEAISALKFILLAACNYGASLLFVYLLHDYLGLHEIPARLLTDALLFITSYTIQREFIFRRKASVPKN